MRKRLRLPIVALLLVMVLVAGTVPISFAEPVERVLIEYAPGKGAMVRNAVQAAGGQVHFEFPDINTMAVSVPGHSLDRLAKAPNVLFVEPDAVRYLAADPYEDEVVPFGIEYVQAPLVWAEGYKGEGVTVCVIDTGYGVHHEDLAGLFVEGYSQVDDEWDFDGYGHGTHVAGTITAVENEVGVIGVSPGYVDLYIVKIFDNAGEWVPQAHASNLMAAAQMCADNGAQIINMSLGGSSKSRAEQRTFDALYEQGVLSVAAAGNDGNDKDHYPASYDSVVSVAAIDSTYTVADFSQFTDQVELAAPGVGVLSTVPFVSVAGVRTEDDDYFKGLGMEFAPYTVEPIPGTLMSGGLCDSSDGWEGNIVLCERGDIDFSAKVSNVMAGGGAAAIIYNNVEGDFSGTLGEEGDWIPAISLSQEAGQALYESYLGTEVEFESFAPEVGSGYEAWGGTSMATPHVCGVAALLWSSNPDLTNAQIREAMAMTALDLGTEGRDPYYGYGLVQAYDALQYLPSEKPGKGPHGPKK